jgi:hypothetical protein
MRPETLKTLGYGVSTVSVMLLGVSAWPGAQRAGLQAPLILGMLTSVAGMACRWSSYELERRRPKPPRPRRPEPRGG